MAGRRRSDRALRDKLRSPGRPGMARREDRLRFWALIAAGLSSEDAAIGAGVSPPVGTRWFREAGGMPSSTFAPSSKPLSGRYLAFAEREEIALALAQDFGVREIARRLGRAASTVSRELRRNAATRSAGLEYRAGNRALYRKHPCRIELWAAGALLIIILWVYLLGPNFPSWRRVHTGICRSPRQPRSPIIGHPLRQEKEMRVSPLLRPSSNGVGSV
jgi:hypothetical protein